MFAQLIPTLFPPEISAPLLQRIGEATAGPGRKIWEDARKKFSNGADYSPDGRFLATIGPDAIRIWNLASVRDVMSLNFGSEIVSRIAFSPDGRELAATMLDGSVYRWDLATGSLLQKTPGLRNVFPLTGNFTH